MCSPRYLQSSGATSHWFANLDSILDHPSKSVTLADDRRRLGSPLVTIQGRPCDQDVATDQPGPCQRFSYVVHIPVYFSLDQGYLPLQNLMQTNRQSVCQAVENGGGRHEREMESGSYSESHTIMIGEQSRSTSERAVLTIDRRIHEDTDVTAFPCHHPLHYLLLK
jgi:hypothetical protein